MRKSTISIFAVFTAITLLAIPTAAEQGQTASVSEQPTATVAAPAETPAPAPSETPAPASPAPVKPSPAPAPVAAAPTCASEINKYVSWNQTIAYNVMIAESGGNVETHNDNNMTGDYSIGCFQINLLGAANLVSKYQLAKNAGYTGQASVEELEPWLKNAANNVNVANQLYTGNGWAPWRYTCQTKVQCY